MAKPIPVPLFDSLDAMLSGDDYTPCLPPSWLADYRQAKQFLLSYQGSLDTFNAYRRELERFLQWCYLIADKTVKQIKRIDIENFLDFCHKPPKRWINTRVEKRFINHEGQRVANKKWRPFTIKLAKAERETTQSSQPKYQLSEAALRALFAIISSYYNYLIQEQYTEVNPVLLIRQKSKYFQKRQQSRSVRRLSTLQWQYVIETAEIMAKESPHHNRTLFIINLLYGLYLRISELTQSRRWTPLMRNFERDFEGRWWFVTVGKGNKMRKISVSHAMLEALKQYRQSLQLSPLPVASEKTPLLAKHHNGTPLTSTRYIRKLVQHCFDQAVLRLKNDNKQDEGQQLMSATVHWLRHTGISDDVKIRPREHVRDDAGHSSSSITDRYIDIELDQRHQSALHKTIKPQKK